MVHSQGHIHFERIPPPVLVTLETPRPHYVAFLPIGRNDLEVIDCFLTQSLSSIRSIHLRGFATEDTFRDLGLGGFEVSTANGGMSELSAAGGASRKITLENRLEFADTAEAFKKQEFWAPVGLHLVFVLSYRIEENREGREQLYCLQRNVRQPGKETGQSGAVEVDFLVCTVDHHHAARQPPLDATFLSRPCAPWSL